MASIAHDSDTLTYDRDTGTLSLVDTAGRVIDSEFIPFVEVANPLTGRPNTPANIQVNNTVYDIRGDIPAAPQGAVNNATYELSVDSDGNTIVCQCVCWHGFYRA